MSEMQTETVDVSFSIVEIDDDGRMVGEPDEWPDLTINITREQTEEPRALHDVILNTVKEQGYVKNANPELHYLRTDLFPGIHLQVVENDLLEYVLLPTDRGKYLIFTIMAAVDEQLKKETDTRQPEPVKFQKSLATSDGVTRVLMYNADRSFMREVPYTDEFDEYFPDGAVKTFQDCIIIPDPFSGIEKLRVLGASDAQPEW